MFLLQHRNEIMTAAKNIFIRRGVRCSNAFQYRFPLCFVFRFPFPSFMFWLRSGNLIVSSATEQQQSFDALIFAFILTRTRTKDTDLSGWKFGIQCTQLMHMLSSCHKSFTKLSVDWRTFLVLTFRTSNFRFLLNFSYWENEPKKKN